ncbi:anti-sigma factor family protein [Planctomicrobium sp. SH661]|uniref:anti-sigma factor family protein n=1 Tax=Planctomicrobium sp. SH661 TaxID=3448124 RepID=UPI003F5CBA35
MDCRTARHLLDCLHDGESIPVGKTQAEILRNRELADHLEHCCDCQHVLEEWRHFDRRMYSMLMSSPVPPALEDRLLAAVDAQTAPSVAQTPARRSRLRGNRRSVSAAVMAMMLLAAGVWWMRPVQEETLNYSGAGELLVSRFLKSNTDWKDLDQFDGSFDLGNFRSDLERFDLSPARGIDLGGGRGQDAAVFEFGLKSWGGILTVLPSQHFTGVPDATNPSVQPGQSILQWRSSDGKLTYICFVRKGSAAALARELFGLFT